jgi:hypothetical protein
LILLGVDANQVPQRDAAAIGRALGCPVDIVGEACFSFVAKSADGASDEDRIIEGICTTDEKDLQGETIDQDGIDWSYFLEHGWLNDIHSKAAGGKVGEPLSVKPVKLPKGVKGHVLKARLHGPHNPDATKIWNVAKATTFDPKLKRRLQFSVQGPFAVYDTHDKKKIVKFIPIEVAVTGHGVNKGTSVKAIIGGLNEVQKSMDAGYPTPSYEGGGSLAPFMFRDVAKTAGCRRFKQRRKPRTMGKEVNAMDNLEILKGLTPEQLARAVAAAGVAKNPDGVTSAPSSEVLKSVEAWIATQGNVVQLVTAALLAV